MERKEMLVITVVVSLGLLSAALGFTCEILRIKETDELLPFDCEYPSVPALVFGLTAAVSLTISQIFLTVSTGGCLCCKRGPYQSNSMSRSARHCFIFSWVTYIIALVLFVTVAALNETHYAGGELFLDVFCSVINPAGVFTGASIMSLITVILSLLYIRKLNSAKNIDNDPSVEGHPAPIQVSNIAMGRPQSPTVIQDPVFVHEDTYIRRQLA